MVRFGARNYEPSTGLLTGTSVGSTVTMQHWNAYGELDSVRTVRAGETLHAARYDRDALGNLLEVRSATDSVVYGVDGRGRRITRKQGTGETHRWLYQGARALVGELDGSDVLRRRWVYASLAHVPDLMVVRGAVDTLYRVVSDHLGSVRLVVRLTDGLVVQSKRYDAWGGVTEDTQPGWQPFGYAGGLEDAATELVRFGARDYEPATGRWLARDPIGFAGGDANLYAYVANDPMDEVDPEGLASIRNHLRWPEVVGRQLSGRGRSRMARAQRSVLRPGGTCISLYSGVFDSD